MELSKKYALTIKETAQCFGIGENKLRQIVANNPKADFVLRVGNRVKIKSKQFSKWLDLISDI